MGQVDAQKGSGQGNLVIEVSESAQDVWLSSKTDLRTRNERWNSCDISTRLYRKAQSSGTLSLYVWNSSEQKLIIKDLIESIRALIPTR